VDEAHERPRTWRRHLRVRWWFLAAIAMLLGGAWWLCARMPGASATGPLPPMTERERAIEADLRGWIDALAGEIGPRSCPGVPVVEGEVDALERAAGWLEAELTRLGHAPTREGYSAGAVRVVNLVAEVAGRDPGAGIVVVGAHYDTYPGTSGANDNASGVAVLLHLAERFADAAPRRTLRFVLFTNEEPPHFQTETMGSLVYAEDCRARGDRIAAMWSLETLAYYTDEPGSQGYPSPILSLAYPDRGDFVAFVGDLGARGLVRDTIGRFRRVADVPSEGAALPGWIAGVGWSDHWSFARVGYPALMITDTALLRDPAYHTPGDRLRDREVLPGSKTASALADAPEGSEEPGKGTIEDRFPGSERLDLGVLARVAGALGDVLTEVAEAR